MLTSEQLKTCSKQQLQATLAELKQKKDELDRDLKSEQEHNSALKLRNLAEHANLKTANSLKFEALIEFRPVKKAFIGEYRRSCI